MAPFTGLHFAQQQRANADALNAQHRQAGQFAHFANLPLAPFVQDHAQPGAFASHAVHPHHSRGGAVAIFQHHAVPPGIHLALIWARSHQHTVLFLVPIAGMCQAVRQFAIIGQQN